MPIDPRKRQKKQERRTAKRKAKYQRLTRAQPANLTERLAAAAPYPVLHCWGTRDLWTEGIGWVCLSRELPGLEVAFSVFLVDRYCLGVKNVIVDVMPRSDYERKVATKMRKDFGSDDMTPATARKFVEGAVEYAHNLGLHPHPDYARAKLLFGTIDPNESPDTFEFGKDGKPFFVAGPHDTPDRCRLILKTLVDRCGPDGFDYLIPLADPRLILPEALQQREARMIGQDASGTIHDRQLDLSGDQDAPGEQP